MASQEIYDYLSVVVGDYTTTTLDLSPQGSVVEMGYKNQVIHLADDGSEERISLDNTSIFWVTLSWNYISDANAGTIFDFYFDSAKANARARSFKLDYGDGHIYIARFDSDLNRVRKIANLSGITEVKFRILGNFS